MNVAQNFADNNWDSLGDAYHNSRPDMVEGEATQAEIISKLETDGEFFIEFFLHEELTMPVPHFHSQELWPLLTSTAMNRVLLAIPRGHAKTTLAKLAVVRYFLFSSHRFCVYVSNTNTFAVNACKDIIGYLTSPNFESVYGRIKMLKESETQSLWIFEIPMPGNRVKKCILRAVGANQQMRGMNIDNQRPDIAVVDDLEDNDNTASPLLQSKLDKWVFGPFIKALDRKHKIIWLGNMLQKTSLLARLSLNKSWNPVVFGALVKDAETGVLRPLWPELWPLEELLKDFREYQDLGLTESWMCEMMNMPGHLEDGFTLDQIRFQAVPAQDGFHATWITLDPAFGEASTTDNTAIVVHGLPKDGCPMVIDYTFGKMRDEEMFNAVLGLAQKWGAWVWGIESVAAQRVLIPFFRVLLITHGIERHVEMLPMMAGRGDPKIGRIRSWVGLMAQGEYAIPDGATDIVTQILSYDMRKNSNDDDLVDACAYGPQILTQYEHLLRAAYSVEGIVTHTPKFGTEVTRV
jgi:hypothetical protein